MSIETDLQELTKVINILIKTIVEKDTVLIPSQSLVNNKPMPDEAVKASWNETYKDRSTEPEQLESPPAEIEVKEPTETEKVQMNLEELRTQFLAFGKLRGRNEAAKALSKIGVKKLGDVPIYKMAEFSELLNSIIETGE
mgnify:CR=1 FL=1|jgi:hypothetical protein